MSWLFEDRLPIICISLAVAGVFIALFYQSRRPVHLLGVGAAAVLLVGGLLVEATVVTENEEIEQLFLDAADALERGDAQALEAMVVPPTDGTEIRAAIYDHLTLRDPSRFKSVSVAIEKIEINESSSPRRARVRIFGRVDVSIDGNTQSFPARLEVWIRKEDGKWLLEEFENYRS